MFCQTCAENKIKFASHKGTQFYYLSESERALKKDAFKQTCESMYGNNMVVCEKRYYEKELERINTQINKFEDIEKKIKLQYKTVPKDNISSKNILRSDLHKVLTKKENLNRQKDKLIDKYNIFLNENGFDLPIDEEKQLKKTIREIKLLIYKVVEKYKSSENEEKKNKYNLEYDNLYKMLKNTKDQYKSFCQKYGINISQTPNSKHVHSTKRTRSPKVARQHDHHTPRSPTKSPYAKRQPSFSF